MLKLRMLDGDVFVHHTTTGEGSIYNIQWFGKPESFGFILKLRQRPNGPSYVPKETEYSPERKQAELWGPYHFM